MDGEDGGMEARFDVRERGHEHCCFWFALLCVLSGCGGGERGEGKGRRARRMAVRFCFLVDTSIPLLCVRII